MATPMDERLFHEEFVRAIAIAMPSPDCQPAILEQKILFIQIKRLYHRHSLAMQIVRQCIPFYVSIEGDNETLKHD
jgi:hypothetical protein